jgi:sulfite reductase alpha subunit-like flavoprotein
MPSSSSTTLYILYGSATGNAEGISKDLAERTAANLPAPFTDVVCKEVDQFKRIMKDWAVDPSSSPSSSSSVPVKKYGVILVCSTTGNGDSPENASRFVRFLKKESNSTKDKPFEHVAYSVLGLGDTNYDVFCAMGKLFDKKMEELGALRAVPLACADEATGLEDVVEPWLEVVIQGVATACMTGEGIKSKDRTAGTATIEIDSTNAVVVVEAEEEVDTITAQQATTPIETPTTSSTTPIAVVDTPSSLETSISDSPLYILYGSATGNAEHIAKDLAATYETILDNPDATPYFTSVVCAELNKFQKLKCLETWAVDQSEDSSLKHGLLIVTSTTGNGDAPENSDRFVRYLKKTAKTCPDPPPFKNVAYAVLGLGDTNYDIFCATAKAVDKKLHDVGGTRVRPLACADEAVGLEDIVDEWTGSILMELTTACRGGGGNVATPSPAGRLVASPVKKSLPAMSVSAQPPEVHNKKYDEEEKKMESHDSPVVSETGNSIINNNSYNNNSSPGVSLVRSILCLDSHMGIPFVENSCLPKVSAASRATLVHSILEDSNATSSDTSSQKQNNDAVSTASLDADDDDECCYTHVTPYLSNIVGARYLTQTSTDAATEICELLLSGGSTDDESSQQLESIQDIMDRRFALLDSVDESEKKVTAELNGKRVIEMTLELPDDGTFEYQPGDSIGLIVNNPPRTVQFLLNLFRDNHGILPSQIICMDCDTSLTIEEALCGMVDLYNTVKNRKILYSLAQFASDPDEKAILELLSSKTDHGEKVFGAYITDQRRSIIDLLHDFPSCQSISIECLLTILPPIPPRYYSVCSSPLVQRANATDKKPSLTVAFSVVDYLTPSIVDRDGKEMGLRRIHGLATGYIEYLCAPFLAQKSSGPNSVTLNSTVKIFPKPTEEFSLPKDLAIPLILIGPGTGIAPFMGFLEHRKALKTTATDPSITPGDVDVFFGCRHSNHDWLYRDELKSFEDEGVISKLYTAFSRTTTTKKEYVQDIMKNNPDCSKRLVDTIVHNKGSVFICGDGNHMARDVQQALADIIGPHLEGSSAEAGKAYIEEMKVNGRFVLDIWS